MRNLNQQKGITLIALIITIIVMMILVGVTINVAFNGGLFDIAREAASTTEKEIEKEQLIEASIGSLDSKGNFNKEKFKTIVTTKLGYEFDETAGKITTPKGYEFYVNEEGEITEKSIAEIDFSGIYYGFNNQAMCEIVNNNTYIIGEEEFPFTVNKNDKTVSINNGDGLELYSYELVLENDNIVNIVLIALDEVDDGYMVLYKNSKRI